VPDGVQGAHVSEYRAVSNRVEEFLGSTSLTREEVQYFFDQLKKTSDDLSRRFAKDAAAMGLLAVLFILLAAQDLSEAEIFGVKLAKFDLVMLLIPIAQALLFVRLGAINSAGHIVDTALKELARKYYAASIPQACTSC